MPVASDRGILQRIWDAAAEIRHHEVPGGRGQPLTLPPLHLASADPGVWWFSYTCFFRV